MNEQPTAESPTEEERYEAVRAAILSEIADGTYDDSRTPEEIEERFGVGLHTVQQITFGMIGRREISRELHPETGISRMVLTKSGRERLARTAETC